MRRIGLTLFIRGMIGIAALFSFVLPALTVELNADRGPVNVNVRLGDAVTTMLTNGEWPAVVLGAIGTFIVSRAAVRFHTMDADRSRWLFTVGTALSLVFPWRVLHAHDQVFLASGTAATAAPHLALGLTIPIGCFLCITGVSWLMRIQAPMPSLQATT